MHARTAVGARRSLRSRVGLTKMRDKRAMRRDGGFVRGRQLARTVPGGDRRDADARPLDGKIDAPILEGQAKAALARPDASVRVRLMAESEDQIDRRGEV